MTESRRVLDSLRQELELWERHLAPVSDEDAAAPRLPNGWSVKDLMAHLAAWQQVTIARLEAARNGMPPHLPDWLQGGDPDSDDEVHRYNARIHERDRHRSWSDVHDAWRSGFERVLRLAAAIPAADLERPGRFAWLDGHRLLDVLDGTYRHHHDDHLPKLVAALAEGRGDTGPAGAA